MQAYRLKKKKIIFENPIILNIKEIIAIFEFFVFVKSIESLLLII